MTILPISSAFWRLDQIASVESESIGGTWNVSIRVIGDATKISYPLANQVAADSLRNEILGHLKKER